MDLLDIGGGFPGSDDAELQFEEVCDFSLKTSERDYTSDSTDVENKKKKKRDPRLLPC